jgi:glycosyltransferase involved in cell wall biosynthesis
LHRTIWQRLPRRARRRLLFALMAGVAPRPGPPQRDGASPLFVAGFLTSASGLGEAARLSLDALCGAKLEAHAIDLSDDLIQSGLAVDYAFAQAARSAGPGTVMLNVNPPLVPLALFRLGRRFIAGKRIIGCWNWELPTLPHDWQTDFRYVHEIWVPSAFTAAAVRARSNLPVRIVPYPLVRRTAADMSRSRPPGVEFLVLTVFNFRSGFTRKNPLGAMAAFAAAFAGDPRAHLLVKSMGGNEQSAEWGELRTAAASAGNVTLIDEVMPAAEISGLIEGADAVLSLHRSEGFGLVLAEAMLRGKPVVATNWSGNVDFLDEKNGCPVAYHLVPAADPRGTYQHPGQMWADPDIAAAAAALRRLRDPRLRRAIGARAAADAARLFAPAAYAARVGDLIAYDSSAEPATAALAAPS